METPRGIIVYHADHGLGERHLALIDAHLEGWDGSLVVDLVPIPDGVPGLPSNLHGPACGDMPVTDAESIYRVRGNRGGPSRLVARPPRLVRSMVIIAGTHEGKRAVFTSYGSQVIAPKEPWDPTLEGLAKEQSHEFWKTHALSEAS